NLWLKNESFSQALNKIEEFLGAGQSEFVETVFLILDNILKNNKASLFPQVLKLFKNPQVEKQLLLQPERALSFLEYMYTTGSKISKDEVLALSWKYLAAASHFSNCQSLLEGTYECLQNKTFDDPIKVKIYCHGVLQNSMSAQNEGDLQKLLGHFDKF